MPNKENLLSKEKAIKQNRIWVRISSSCNNRCVFCLDSNAHDWTFVEENLVKKQIKDWFKEWNDNRIIISGWEASINPKFSEYIKHAREIWYNRIQTVTNWNMFANEDFCKKVFDAWLEEVTFSFHWHNETLHDYLVSTPWAFKKSLKWLIYIKKNFPKVILNIDIVVNKINIKFLPEIIKFFIKLWIYEFDILQIIPFWRWFTENKNKLFYSLEENISYLQETWELSKIPWMYMWTNRFPVEAFDWYEDLIQDPRKIKWEIFWEWEAKFIDFYNSLWEKKLDCFKKWACEYCFLNQYCNDFLKDINLKKIEFQKKYEIISWEESVEEVYKKYWENKEDFINFFKKHNNFINIPVCLNWTWIFQTYNDLKEKNTLEDYTKKYIKNLYRRKSLKCKKCKYYNECKWIHINFIRAYSFDILNPILD